MARRNEGRNPPATALAPATRLHRLQRYVQRYRIRLYANIDAIRVTARTVRSHTGNRGHAGNRMPRRQIEAYRNANLPSHTKWTTIGSLSATPQPTLRRLCAKALREMLWLLCQSHDLRCGAYALRLYERCCGSYAKATIYAGALMR